MEPSEWGIIKYPYHPMWQAWVCTRSSEEDEEMGWFKISLSLWNLHRAVTKSIFQNPQLWSCCLLSSEIPSLCLPAPFHLLNCFPILKLSSNELLYKAFPSHLNQKNFRPLQNCSWFLFFCLYGSSNIFRFADVVFAYVLIYSIPFNLKSLVT